MISRLRSRHPFLWAAVVAGIAAGIVSTLVQIGLWLLFTDAFPAILWRDARLTAALVLGPGVLVPSGVPDWGAMAVATLIHFGLSVAYSAVMCAVTRCLAGYRSLAAGAALGLALYGVNLHGFTLLFPWFEVARGWITLAAHLAFGLTVAATCRLHR